MKQQTLAMVADEGAGFETRCKRTRRDGFLDTMNTTVPWAELSAMIEPHYPKRGNGCPSIGLERMLRIHFVQHWFNLADFACAEALYESSSLRRFVGIDLGWEAMPDANAPDGRQITHGRPRSHQPAARRACVDGFECLIGVALKDFLTTIQPRVGDRRSTQQLDRSLSGV
jgi:hypothetical protein